MENKYYTPEIEELYVGLECEHTSNMLAFEVNNTSRIYKEKLNQTDLSNYLIWEIEEGGLEKFIRIKYLDQEDIESLGFKRKAISRSEWSKVVNDQIFTIHEFWTYNRSERENLIRITSGKENNFPYRIKFEGDIKNKSELVRVLKQLNIK